MNGTLRIGSLTRKLSQTPLIHRKPPPIAPFSSSSSASNPNPPNPEVKGPSEVYRNALRTQRPPAIRWSPSLQNSVCFIGTVDRPLSISSTKTTGRFGAYTVLRARNPCNSSNRTLRIFVEIWEDMAKMCMEHLELGDCIYVSGRLGSYTKADEDGIVSLHYKIIVKELCYVAPHRQGETCQKHEDTESEASNDSQAKGGQPVKLELPDSTRKEGSSMHTQVEHGREWDKHKLKQWEVFFTNPHEWWDQRSNKKYLHEPDFRHKHSGEGLCLDSDDPPWVKSQLQLLDSKRAEERKDKLKLWQVFFTNPHEWWDNRSNKKNLRSPDFRHKHCGEALWLNHDDPPWIKSQLQLLDSKRAEGSHIQDRDEYGMQRDNGTLKLWQVFFANPQEWWDNRKNKKNSCAPDFQHKHTDQALWLDPNDPPWVKRQLQFLDSGTAKQGQADYVCSRSHIISSRGYDD